MKTAIFVLSTVLAVSQVSCGRFDIERLHRDEDGVDGGTNPDGYSDTDAEEDSASGEDSDSFCNPVDFCCDESGVWKKEEVGQSGATIAWRRCPIGQNWISGASCGCNGQMSLVQWCAAVGIDAAGYCTTSTPGIDMCENRFPGTGYRTPTRQEYVELLGNCPLAVLGGNSGVCDTCGESETCSSMFGNDTQYYWSSTSYNDGEAWLTFFELGAIGNHSKQAWAGVRCVRDVMP